MSATFIICPSGLVTGGAELLHQLASVLRADGRNAHIVYHPFADSKGTPAEYIKYNVSVARRGDIRSGDTVVLPEIYTAMANDFAGNRVLLWWLSVDNFRLGLGSARVARLLPRFTHGMVRALGKRIKFLYRMAGWAGQRGGIAPLAGVELHLHQSEFARQFLEANGLGPTAPLSDYLNDDYLDAIANPSTRSRENLVTFNPLKGAERTRRIVEELADRGIEATPVPIKGFTRAQVLDLLARAKIYIDFGNHPGKDRIPREAAAMGACVIVNKRGSAGNEIDVPLSDEYKIDDERDGFEVEAAEKIRAVLDDFAKHSAKQAAYRERLSGERDEFIRQSLALFQ